MPCEQSRPPVILVLGGVRSGKSRYAQQLAARGGRVALIATAEGRDEDMRQRIAHHRKERPASWTTIEAPIDLPGALNECGASFETIVVDCLTLWASNLLEREQGNLERVFQQTESLADSLHRCAASVVLVSNEVGSGIVPDNELGRVYRDVLGVINQRIAAVADEVVLLVAGCPVSIKRTTETTV
jgi:adenosylcobinamide kinase / adenosylcobinamide-phosphate guanylyltransferase